MKDYGSIYLRKDGYYYGRVSYNKVKKSFYGKTKKEVQDKINDWVVNAKYNNVSSNNVVLFSEYCRNYLFTYKYGFIKDSSFDRLESILDKHIKDSEIDVSIYKLDDVVVQKYLNSKRSCSSSTLKKVYGMIKTILGYAYRKRDIEIDIANMLILPRSTKDVKHIDIYTDDEVEMFQNALGNCCDNSVMCQCILSYVVILNTGLRASEMLALRWSDIDLKNNIIIVKHSLSRVKNRDGPGYNHIIGNVKTVQSCRRIPINELARGCFMKLRDVSDCDYVISNHGDFINLNRYQEQCKRICKYLGIQHKGIHALRHTFASRLIRRGVPPKVVSELLGHTSVIFTIDRYVHSYEDDVIDAVHMLDRDVFVLSDEMSVEVSGK